MALLFQRFSHAHKTSSNMKQQRGPSSESLSASMHSFESEVYNYLAQLSLTSEAGSEEIRTFSWIQTCLRVLPIIDTLFAKFIADVDFPVTNWKGVIVEEYLRGNSCLLDHFNCISSSVNHLSQACMELLHALNISSKLKEIQPWSCKKKFDENRLEEKTEERIFSEKELIVYKALLVRNHAKNWICTSIDSSIRGDTGKNYVSMTYCVKEVWEVNECVVRLLANAGEERNEREANELNGKVEMLRKLLEGVKEDVNRLFSEAMIRRNELLDSLRSRKL
ncbi:hypothetical protein ACHQM5_019096 [Ranunculus cassubicifolius]